MILSPAAAFAGTICFAVAGTLVGGLAGCIPAFHIFHLLAAAAIVVPSLADPAIPTLWLDAAVAGMITGWSILNSLPAILLAAPDESALFTLQPGRRLLMDGRGPDAVLLTTLGAAGGMACLLALACAAPFILPPIHSVLSPHYHWILWCVIAFLLLSEWPQGRTAAQAPMNRFLSGNRNVFMGLLTFLLSGLLGFVLLYRPDLVRAPHGQTLAPAFAGLFALPWLLVNLVSRVRIPSQQLPARHGASARDLAHGIAAGTTGGAFAAFVPVVSGGVGGLLAGHAFALRGERAFLISQGASKTVYYAGALLLWFVPGLHVARGGGAAFLRGMHAPAANRYPALVLCLLIAAGIAILLTPVLTAVLTRALNRFGYKALSWLAFALTCLIVLLVSGTSGILVMVVAAGIGLIPAVLGGRRTNCLGVILLPLACNMSGIGPAVAAFLGIE